MSLSVPRPRRRCAAPKRPTSEKAARPGSGPLGWAVGRARAVGEATQDILGGAARSVTTPTGMLGAAVEAAWLTTHLALSPASLTSRGVPSSMHADALKVLTKAWECERKVLYDAEA